MGKRRRTRGGGLVTEPAPKRPAFDTLQEEEDASKDQAQGWRCQVCALSFNSEAQWTGHLKGKKHRRMEQQQAAAPPSSPPSPSSDTEDYDVFRQRAPRIKKKKNRTRERDREVDQAPPPTPTSSGPSATPSKTSATRLHPTPFLSAFCRVRHACERIGGQSCTCPSCSLDLTQDKLLVSRTQCPIRQVAFLAKGKFQAHTDKGVNFLQCFVLIMDLRVAACVLRSVRWAQPLFRVRDHVHVSWDQ